MRLGNFMRVFISLNIAVQWEGVQCDETEADTELPIAAPAWPSYGTRPSLRTGAFCALCAPLEADFVADTGHSARAGVSWVGFSVLERPRGRALGGMSSSMASETRFTLQIPGSPAAHVPC